MKNIDITQLRFTRTHEWVSVEEGGATVVVGITQHAQELLGDIVFVELPEVGRDISQAQELAVVESVKAAADIYAPVSGTVIAVNDRLTTEPESINQDPYGAGWIFKLQLSNTQELDDLVDAEQYEHWLED